MRPGCTLIFVVVVVVVVRIKSYLVPISSARHILCMHRTKADRVPRELIQVEYMEVLCEYMTGRTRVHHKFTGPFVQSDTVAVLWLRWFTTVGLCTLTFGLPEVGDTATFRPLSLPRSDRVQIQPTVLLEGERKAKLIQFTYFVS